MNKIFFTTFISSLFVSAVLGGGYSDCTEAIVEYENLSQALQTQFYDLITFSSHRPENEIILAVKEETLDILSTYPDLSEDDINILNQIDFSGDSGALCIINFINTFNSPAL